MLTEAISGVIGNSFCKHPGLVVVGAIPVGEDYLSKQGQYFTKDVYTVNSTGYITNTSEYVNDRNYKGTLFYSEWYGNYCLVKENEHSGIPLLAGYPIINYGLNIFSNGETGFSSTYVENMGYNLILNPDDGYLYCVPNLNILKKNGICGKGQFHDLTYSTQFLSHPYFYIDRSYYYKSEKTWDEMLSTIKTTGESRFYFYQIDWNSEYNSPQNSTSFRLYYHRDIRCRTDILPDLDHEKDNSIPEICGIYIAPMYLEEKYKAIGVGSLILTDKNSSEYDFAGINELLGDINGKSNSKIVEEIDDDGNVISTTTYKWRYYIIGKNTSGEKTRKIVYMYSSDLTDEYKAYRCFILEGESNDPVDYRKFWYSDAFNSLSYIKLFWSGDGETIPETQFTYIDLDDETSENDIILTPKGMSRINPYEVLSLGIKHHNQLNNYNKNICVSNWISPVVNIKDE